MADIKIKFKVLEVFPDVSGINVHYYTDEYPTGTTLHVTVYPDPWPTGIDLENYIFSYAPVDWLVKMSRLTVKKPDTRAALTLVNKEVVETTKHRVRNEPATTVSTTDIGILAEEIPMPGEFVANKLII